MILAAQILTAAVALGIVYVGLRYLLAPAASAATFGLPDWPTEQFHSWLNLKGVRDIGTGVVTAAVLLTATPPTVGVVMLAMAVIPAGDMLVVLRYRGRRALAYGMHGATAAAMAVAGLVLLLG
jgi:hypothetical protein